MKMAKILKTCGDVCNTTGPFPPPPENSSFSISKIDKHFDCPTLVKERAHDEEAHPGMQHPHMKIPKFMKRYFTYEERVKLHDGLIIDTEFVNFRNPKHFQNPDAKVEKQIFKAEEMNQTVEGFKKGNFSGGGGGYGYTANISRLIGKNMNLQGKRVVVVGSETMWLECLAFFHGAKMVFTLEYRLSETKYPNHYILQPKDFFDAFAQGELAPFDAVLEFGSIEHSGLGRYTDGLHPWGDLVTMARMWCVLKDDGLMLTSMQYGADIIAFNMHKCYGPIMASHRLANWEVKDQFITINTTCADHVQILAKSNLPVRDKNSKPDTAKSPPYSSQRTPHQGRRS